LDEKTTDRAEFFVKVGSLAGAIKKDRLTISWLSFPTVPVYTTTDKQYKSYPVGNTGFNGAIKLKVSKWHHLAFTYDPILKVARTYIDHQLDQTRYFSNEEALPMQSKSSSPLMLFRGMKNIKV